MIKPYHEERGIKIYNCDCLELLPELPMFDLLLTDPPYGIGASRKAFGFGRIKGGGFLDANGSTYQPRQFPESSWDDQPASEDLINLACSKAIIQIIWGGNYFNLPPSMRWLVWDKRNDGTDFSDCELAWTNQDKAVRMFRYRWNGMLQEHHGRHKEERLHPTMKPLALMKWCLTFALDVKTILDPFMGSGTTLIAAKHAGISAVGIEREEKYCEVAANRLRQETFEFNT